MRMGGSMPTNSGEKGSAKSLRYVFQYMKSYTPLIVIAFLSAIIGAVLMLVGPGLISNLTEVILENMSMSTNGMKEVLDIAIMLGIFYIVSVLLSYLSSFIMTTLSHKTAKRLRTNLSAKVNKLPFSYLDSTPYGDTISKITNDVDTISNTFSNNLASLLANVCLLVGSTFMMLITNWILALSAIAASLLGFLLMAVIMKKSQKYFQKNQEILGELNGQIEEVYASHQLIAVNNGHRQVGEKFSKTNEGLRKSVAKSQFYSGLMMPLMTVISNLGYVVVCVVGAVLVAESIIGISVIVAFMMYVRLFTQPLSSIGESMGMMQQAGAASKRVFDFLNLDELADESGKTKMLEECKGNVSFKNVKFSYDKVKPIINDFSTEIKAGQKVAIVGPTGAGKTTIVNLLMRFYEIDGGEISVDGVNISDMKRSEVHRLFGMVLQDTWLFEGSIYENLRYNNENVTDEKVVEICKVVGIDHYIRSLENGYDSILSEKVLLSAGQKQLFTIARAMLNDKPMLILDEATSSVDTKTEKVIQEAMDRLTQKKTSFIIAHRLSTIKNADKILVMKDGDIIEQGKHTTLIKKGGFYADLYNSQFEVANEE